MDHDEETQSLAQTEENESIFLFGVVRVVDQERALVREDRLRVFERDLVLPKIDVPIVRMPYVCGNGWVS